MLVAQARVAPFFVNHALYARVDYRFDASLVSLAEETCCAEKIFQACRLGEIATFQATL